MTNASLLTIAIALHAGDSTRVTTYGLGDAGSVVITDDRGWDEYPEGPTEDGHIEVLRNGVSEVHEFTGEEHRLLEDQGDLQAMLQAIAGGQPLEAAFKGALEQAAA